jgi:hypothetical protein
MNPNLFLLAIDKAELVDFALGNGDYFIADREYGVHWVLGSWLYHILPVINDLKNIRQILNEMLSRLIDERNISIEVKNDTLVYHLHVFYYLRKEKRIKGEDFFSDLNLKINDVFNSTKHYLINSGQQSKIESLDFAIDLIKRNGGLKGQ